MIFLEKAGNLATSFREIYEKEEQSKIQLEIENLQKKWLEKGCEQEIQQNICQLLQKKGIEIKGCKVHIEGGAVKTVIWLSQAPDPEMERRIKDALEEEWGISWEDCEVLTWEMGIRQWGILLLLGVLMTVIALPVSDKKGTGSTLGVLEAPPRKQKNLQKTVWKPDWRKYFPRWKG